MASSNKSVTPQDVGARRSTEALTESLRTALAAMEPALNSDSSHELSKAEADYFRSGGLVVERQADADPIGRTAVEFAALIASSLSAAEMAKRLNAHPSKVRQWIMSRSLYSLRIDSRRLVPQFQLLREGGLVPGIRQVNRELDSSLHPVEVLAWYTTPNPDLVRAPDDAPITPLEWLKAGFSPDTVAELAAQL